jgi:hypothetical protein
VEALTQLEPDREIHRRRLERVDELLRAAARRIARRCREIAPRRAARPSIAGKSAENALEEVASVVPSPG